MDTQVQETPEFPRQRNFIMSALALYFGWLLALPFYGPVLYVAVPEPAVHGPSMPMIFALAHAATLFIAGSLAPRNTRWKPLVLASVGATLAVHLGLLLPWPGAWPLGMALGGVASALFILGWSIPYSLSLPLTGRLPLMAATIIGANLVLLVCNYLAPRLPSALVLALTGLPLVLALAMVYRVPAGFQVDTPLPVHPRPLPKLLLLVFCLFVAGLYLNGGFMYNVMVPALDFRWPLFSTLRFLPYIAVLLVMYRFGENLQRYFPVYMGVSLLGLAFVSFALLEGSLAGFLLTTGLVEGAFALLDLFLWVMLGYLAFLYHAPLRFFGLALGANVASIILGDFIGSQLLDLGDTYRLFTAMFAAAAIFLAFAVMPWLNQRLERDLAHALEDLSPDLPEVHTPLERLLTHLLPQENLTPRELEITALLLQGLSNQDVAQELFISQNTLKTHLRHIYGKFGVSQKRQLLALAAGSNPENPSSRQN